MNNLTVFEFESNQVRIADIDGELWFVAKDICDVLCLTNVSQAVSRLEDFEKRELGYDQVITLNDDPSTKRLLAVSESGMYALILSSRKKQAKVFRLWVTQEVLPSIRRTGEYQSKPTSKRSREEILADHEIIDSIFADTYLDMMVIAEFKLMVVTRPLSEVMDIVRSFIIHKQWSWNLNHFVEFLNKDPIRKEHILYQLQEKILMGELIPLPGIEPLPSSTLWQRELRKGEGYEN